MVKITWSLNLLGFPLGYIENGLFKAGIWAGYFLTENV